jgi:transcriptional regulator with XRE-family HTH domain
MGERPRPKPSRLPEKLKEIRRRIDGGLTQVELIKRLGYTEEELPQDRISKFERGTMEPSLAVLIAYSEAANCYLEAIVMDERDLGAGAIPYSKKHHGVPVQPTARGSAKTARKR